MSVDKSLVSRVSMTRARNVYSRAERLEILKKAGRLSVRWPGARPPEDARRKDHEEGEGGEGEEGRRGRGCGPRRCSGRGCGCGGRKARCGREARRCRCRPREGRGREEAREEVDSRAGRCSPPRRTRQAQAAGARRSTRTALHDIFSRSPGGRARTRGAPISSRCSPRSREKVRASANGISSCASSTATPTAATATPRCVTSLSRRGGSR